MLYYNAIIAEPAPVIAAMKSYSGAAYDGVGPCFLDLAAVPGLDREDYDISRLTIRESLRGQACVLMVSLKAPNASFLVSGGGKYLLVWTDLHCPPGRGRVLGFGMIDPLPSNIGSAEGRVDIEAYCRLEDWQRTTRNALRSAVDVDRRFYDPDTGPSTLDLMSCSSLVPTINRCSLGVFLRQSYAAIDVDTSRPAGNVLSNGIIAYDVTDYAARNGFELRKGSVVPILKLSTKLQVPWTQYAAGTCDLSGLVILGAFSPFGGGLLTYTPTEFKSSFPKSGSSIGTGWTVQRSNLISTSFVKKFFRSTAEPLVADALSKDYELMATSGSPFGDSDGRGVVLVPYETIQLAPGANVGFVAWYEYTQQRRETLTMITTLKLNPLVTGGLPAQTGAKVAISDPTMQTSGTAWLPNTPYAADDVAWFGGLRQRSKLDHLSGDEFDQSLWDADDPDEGPPGFAWYWSANTYYVAGDVVHPEPGDDSYWYRNKTGYSVALSGGNVATFVDDQAAWTQGPPPVRDLSPEAPEYLSSARGAVTIAHQDQRHYATLLANAKCVEGVFRLRFDDLLDPAMNFRAMDLSVGHVLRVRTDPLTSGIAEVIGVIDEFEMTMGPNGSGSVNIVLGLIPGTGLSDASGSAVPGETDGPYAFSPARTPIDVSQLWNPNYACLGVSRTGASFETQQNLIQAAIDETSVAETFTYAISSAIGEQNGNRFKIMMRPLIQEGLIPLQHRTMVMKPKLAPKNIEFTS